MTIPNIGPRQRRYRTGLGIVAGVLGATLLGAMLGADAPRAWRLVLFAPFFGAGLGMLQVREKT